jgi:hypothetical protein
MALFNRKKKEAAAGKGSAKAGKGEAPKESQLKVIKDAFRVTRKEKPLFVLWFILIFVVVEAIGVLFGQAAHHPVYFGIIFTPLSFLTSFFYFTRQANSAAYASIEGEIGAAASVLMSIRKGWTTTAAVNVSKNQDMVHRSVGLAGIVLVGEGGNGVRSLLADEKKKTERFVPGVPVTEIIVGDGEGQVKLRKLQKKMKKLPKKLSKNQMREVRNRLKAIGGMSMPIPKGPMPINTNKKLPRR